MKIFYACAAFLLTMQVVSAAEVPVTLPTYVRDQYQALCGQGDYSVVNAEGVMQPGELVSHTVDADLILRLIPCLKGAYNFAYLGYIQSGEDWSPVYLPIVADEGIVVSQLIQNPEYDAKARLLKTFAKHRGVGDCGEAGEYHLSKDAGQFDAVLARNAMLEKYWFKQECDEKPFTPNKSTLVFDAAKFIKKQPAAKQE